MLTCYGVEHERLPNGSNRPLLRSTGKPGVNSQYPSPCVVFEGEKPRPAGITFSANRCPAGLDRSEAGPRSAVAAADLQPGEDYAAAPAAAWSALVLCPCKPNRRMALPFPIGRLKLPSPYRRQSFSGTGQIRPLCRFSTGPTKSGPGAWWSIRGPLTTHYRSLGDGGRGSRSQAKQRPRRGVAGFAKIFRHGVMGPLADTKGASTRRLGRPQRPAKNRTPK
jgi:hypothetical protein